MAVRIYLEESARRFETGVRELEVLGGFMLAGDGVPVRWSEAGVPGISWDGSRAQLSGAGEAQFFRGLGLLRERLAGGAAPFEQTEAPVFRGLGASFDLSRNAVMTVDALKRMLCRMALMGYNEAYLYTEDTYALPEYPFFGYQRGRYGAEALRALDGQARQAAEDCGALRTCWRQLWMAECRPQGFEVLELRLAGVQARLEAAAARTEDWCAGSVQRLEELEEGRLLLLRTPGTSRLHGVYFWREIASASKCF